MKTIQATAGIDPAILRTESSPAVADKGVLIPASSPRRSAAELPLPRGWYARSGRRLLDLALLSIALPLALPPLALIALANLVLFGDPRKVFFRQDRVGRHGRIFRIYKFRTMRETSEGQMSSWSRNACQLRVTPFGRLLRNTHMDELPQLFNVLRGDMGFIGPRPEMVEIERWACEHIPHFSHRLAIRPGITGLAQITQGYTGRCVDSYARKLEINLAYLQHVSFALDVQIVLRTVVWMLRGRGWDWNQPVQGPERPTPADR